MDTPLYLQTRKKSVLKERIEKAWQILEECTLCPRKCKVNRLKEETGICKTGFKAKISSYAPHFGEEASLVGRSGSGAIFFTNCSLLCIFCQNYDTSHEEKGCEISNETLSDIMLFLQKTGTNNINFVTPTHVVPQILKSLEIAIEKGLKIPLVYNTSGYENIETIKLLEGIIDIYMPDFKFWDSEISKLLCNAKDYPEKAKKSLKEMQRQVGVLETNDQGIATKGVLIRHLVMPNNFAGTKDVMKFIAEKISNESYVNIMPQYRSCYKAYNVKEISRAITVEEFEEAVFYAKEFGIEKLDKEVAVRWF